MDIQTLKLNLVAKILATDKTFLLEQINSLFQNEEPADWWDQLPKEVQESILEGLDDLAAGRVYSHDQVIEEAKQKYGF